MQPGAPGSVGDCGVGGNLGDFWLLLAAGAALDMAGAGQGSLGVEGRVADLLCKSMLATMHKGRGGEGVPRALQASSSTCHCHLLLLGDEATVVKTGGSALSYKSFMSSVHHTAGAVQRVCGLPQRPHLCGEM